MFIEVSFGALKVKITSCFYFDARVDQNHFIASPNFDSKQRICSIYIETDSWVEKIQVTAGMEQVRFPVASLIM